jgi:hypothetical protein
MLHRKGLHPSRRAAFLRGMAIALDLGATMAPSARVLSRGPAADADALRGDWNRAIGRATEGQRVSEARETE